MRFVNWLFRDRTTGSITVAQFPNWSLSTWIVATVVDRVVKPQGTTGSVVHVVAVASLLVWAADEVVRGVNPFRRILGAVVGIITLVGLAT